MIIIIILIYYNNLCRWVWPYRIWDETYEKRCVGWESPNKTNSDNKLVESYDSDQSEAVKAATQPSVNFSLGFSYIGYVSQR